MAEETAGTAEPINVAETVTELMNPEKSAQLLDAGMDLLVQYGPNVIFAILIFYIGKIIAKLVKGMVARVMSERGC